MAMVNQLHGQVMVVLIAFLYCLSKTKIIDAAPSTCDELRLTSPASRRRRTVLCKQLTMSSSPRYSTRLGNYFTESNSQLEAFDGESSRFRSSRLKNRST